MGAPSPPPHHGHPARAAGDGIPENSSYVKCPEKQEPSPTGRPERFLSPSPSQPLVPLSSFFSPYFWTELQPNTLER